MALVRRTRSGGRDSEIADRELIRAPRNTLIKSDITWLQEYLPSTPRLIGSKTTQIPQDIRPIVENLWCLYQRKYGEFAGPPLDKLLLVIQSMGQLLFEVSDAAAQQCEITFRAASINLQKETNDARALCVDAFTRISAAMSSISRSNIADLSHAEGAVGNTPSLNARSST